MTIYTDYGDSRQSSRDLHNIVIQFPTDTDIELGFFGGIDNPFDVFDLP